MFDLDDVAELVYRRYLTPMFDQPVASVLSVGVDAVAATVTVAPFSLIEYSDAVAPGTVIEVDRELMRVVSVAGGDNDSTPLVLTVARGVMGTGRTAHVQGAEVTVAPFATRQDVYDYVYAELEGLWPDLWISKMATVPFPYDLPVDFGTLQDAWVVNPQGFLYPLRSVKAVRTADPDAPWRLSLVKEQEFEVRVLYAARPGEFSDGVTTFVNAQWGWRDIVALGVAASVVVGSNVSRLRTDYLTEMMETQVSEQVSPSRIATQLRQAQRIAVMRERDRLRAEDGTSTHLMPVV